MTEPYVEVRDLWKKFRRGELHDSLRDLVPALARRLVGRVPRQVALGKGDFWALRAVNFDVRPGQTLGVLGPNGAGKSTLLKVLTKVLRPTRGYCRIEGRVGALIEVAAGFHPDLTGRENVFLQGAIMGMPQAEIRRKFDEIVAFSGIAEFMDTPVKRYSTGMNARLGFSVAAHLDPEVLIIDEVLAVGDFAFQGRAFGRIAQLARSGIPVLVVSHQLDRIASLCTDAILLNHGEVVQSGTPQECIAAYLGTQGRLLTTTDNGYPLAIASVSLVSSPVVRSGEPVRLRIECRADGFDRQETDTIGVRIRALRNGETLFGTGTSDFNLRLPERGEFSLDLDLQMNVAAGIYSAETHIWNHKRGRDVLLGPSLVFQVMDGIRFWGNVQMNPRMALQAPQSADAARSPA
ncbi:MAG TPA: polysaccharide ABC transporter ATP-binding protein [Gemmatimonadales bacterium]|nr:polysaccharide ABC transporter ATP-binding protein [Gemmatimonadales bacterium]